MRKATLFIVALAISTAFPIEAQERVFMGLDVSRSLDQRLWRSLTARVAADVASLPEGTALNISTFGATVDEQPLFRGSLDRHARETIIRRLEALEPRHSWTFFEPLLRSAQLWLGTHSEPVTLLIYSDGESSLPGSEFRDAPIAAAADGTAVVASNCDTFLWRPGAQDYILVGGPGVKTGGKRLATLEDALGFSSEWVKRREQLSTLQEIESTTREYAVGWGFLRALIEEIAVPERAILGLTLLGSFTFLFVWRSQRARSWALIHLPRLLTRDLFDASSADCADSCTDDVPPRPNKCSGPCFKVWPPQGRTDEAYDFPLPKPGAEVPVGGDLGQPGWRPGLQVNLVLRCGIDGGFFLVNQGNSNIKVSTPLGNEIPCHPHDEVEVRIDDEISLPGHWTACFSPDSVPDDLNHALFGATS